MKSMVKVIVKGRAKVYKVIVKGMAKVIVKGMAKVINSKRYG